MVVSCKTAFGKATRLTAQRRVRRTRGVWYTTYDAILESVCCNTMCVPFIFFAEASQWVGTYILGRGNLFGAYSTGAGVHCSPSILLLCLRNCVHVGAALLCQTDKTRPRWSATTLQEKPNPPTSLAMFFRQAMLTASLLGMHETVGRDYDCPAHKQREREEHPQREFSSSSQLAWVDQVPDQIPTFFHTTISGTSS